MASLNRDIAGATKNFALGEKPILLRVHRMRFDFDAELPGEREYLLHAARRVQRRERIEQISDAVASSQDMIRGPSIKPIPDALLTALKGKIAPHAGAGRQKTSQEHVGAKVHVMVTVQPLRLFSKETSEFLALGRNEILERPRESGVEHDRGQTVAPQISGNRLQVLPDLSRTPRSRKRGCEIQVQAGVDASL